MNYIWHPDRVYICGARLTMQCFCLSEIIIEINVFLRISVLVSDLLYQMPTLLKMLVITVLLGISAQGLTLGMIGTNYTDIEIICPQQIGYVCI